MNDDKRKALAEYLNELNDDIEHLYDNTYADGSCEYLVLTDSEADTATREYIIDTLWAFKASFILNFLGIWTDEAEKSLTEMQGKLCESANELIKAMIGNQIDEFIEEAVSADGRGHFIAHYDHEENEIKYDDEYYYIYRTN